MGKLVAESWDSGLRNGRLYSEIRVRGVGAFPTLPRWLSLDPVTAPMEYQRRFHEVEKRNPDMTAEQVSGVVLQRWAAELIAKEDEG